MEVGSSRRTLNRTGRTPRPTTGAEVRQRVDARSTPAPRVPTDDPVDAATVLAGDEIPIVIERRNVVPPDVRRYVAAHELTRRDDRWGARRTVALFGGWAGSVGVGVAADRWWVWCAVAAVNAVWFSTIFAYVHHSTHGNLFTNRMLNHVAGGAAGALALMPTCAYRAFHATHHAWTRTADDPENLPVGYRNKWHYGVIFLATGLGLSAILWAGAFATLVGRPPRWVRLQSHRRHIRRWIALPIVLLATGAWAVAAFPTAAVFGWLVPTVLANLVAVAFFTLPDHLGSELDLPILDNSRTTESNRFGRWIYLYDNYHAAYHLVPSVPPCRLAELDELIRDRTALVSPGFTAVHRSMLAGLPWFARRPG